MKRHGVCPSVRVCGGFAAVGPVGRKHRSTAARPVPQQHGTQQQIDPSINQFLHWTTSWMMSVDDVSVYTA